MANGFNKTKSLSSTRRNLLLTNNPFENLGESDQKNRRVDITDCQKNKVLEIYNSFQDKNTKIGDLFIS
jgi:hypothetical protein